MDITLLQKAKNKKLVAKKEIYNPFSNESIEERQIFGGNPTSIFELTKIKYQWAYNLWKTMLANTWFPAEVNMSEDKKDYEELTDKEKEGYDKALAQLIFMDSLQTNNLSDNINPYITAPEINLLLVRQAYEESLHSQSYAVMVESISKNTTAIYDMWRVDTMLRHKNDYIANIYINLAKNPTETNIVKAMYANQILEGIYFYSGFCFFYALAIFNKKMLNTAQMIRFIHRDENTHLSLFQHLIKTLMKEKSYLFTQSLRDEVIELFRQATELESSWGYYIVGDGLANLNPSSLRQYIQFLADTRLKAVELPAIYNVNNPFKDWINDYAQFNTQRTNFFEGRVGNYSKGSLSFDNF